MTGRRRRPSRRGCAAFLADQLPDADGLEITGPPPHVVRVLARELAVRRDLAQPARRASGRAGRADHATRPGRERPRHRPPRGVRRVARARGAARSPRRAPLDRRRRRRSWSDRRWSWTASPGSATGSSSTVTVPLEDSPSTSRDRCLELLASIHAVRLARLRPRRRPRRAPAAPARPRRRSTTGRPSCGASSSNRSPSSRSCSAGCAPTQPVGPDRGARARGLQARQHAPRLATPGRRPSNRRHARLGDRAPRRPDRGRRLDHEPAAPPRAPDPGRVGARADHAARYEEITGLRRAPTPTSGSGTCSRTSSSR